jgi:hypothetical protein
MVLHVLSSINVPMIILGKTVYILGAGASHHAGVPLMGGFLDKSIRLLSSTNALDNVESFHEIAKWVGSMKKSSADSLVDVTNIEEAYSLLYMQKEAGISDAEGPFNHLRMVMCETIDQYGMLAEFQVGTNPSIRITAEHLFYDFVQNFDQKNRERESLIKSDYARAKFTADSIITFNYDLLLDLGFKIQNLPVNYGYANIQDHGRYKILKLHGSLNWITHPGCDKGSEISAINPTELIVPMASPIFRNHRFNTSSKIRAMTCPKCSYAAVMTPLLIPPTWNKNAEKDIARVWHHAIYELKNAEQIIVIGYSLPPTDAYFKYLLVTGLKDNEQLRRIIVVNTDPEISKRFDSIAPSRVKVIPFIHPFESFVKAMGRAYDYDAILDNSQIRFGVQP